jgi:hypothetical protein
MAEWRRAPGGWDDQPEFVLVGYRAGNGELHLIGSPTITGFRITHHQLDSDGVTAMEVGATLVNYAWVIGDDWEAAMRNMAADFAARGPGYQRNTPEDRAIREYVAGALQGYGPDALPPGT